LMPPLAATRPRISEVISSSVMSRSSGMETGQVWVAGFATRDA
jgi:hypothetical protein